MAKSVNASDDSGSDHESTQSTRTKKLKPEDKWLHGIQLPATIQDIEGYIVWRLSRYEEHDVIGDDLSIIYGQDFSNFTAETFERTDQAIQSRLRKFLRKYGVYMDKTRGTRLSDALVAVLKELPWPSGDEDRPKSQYKQTTTSKPSNPIQSRPTSAALPQTPTPGRSRIEQPQLSTPVTGQPRRIQSAEPAVTFESVRQDAPTQPIQQANPFRTDARP